MLPSLPTSKIHFKVRVRNTQFRTRNLFAWSGAKQNKKKWTRMYKEKSSFASTGSASDMKIHNRLEWHFFFCCSQAHITLGITKIGWPLHFFEVATHRWKPPQVGFVIWEEHNALVWQQEHFFPNSVARGTGEYHLSVAWGGTREKIPGGMRGKTDAGPYWGCLTLWREGCNSPPPPKK